MKKLRTHHGMKKYTGGKNDRGIVKMAILVIVAMIILISILIYAASVR